MGEGGLPTDAGGMRKGKDRPHTDQINHPVCQEHGGHLIHGPPSEGNRGKCVFRERTPEYYDGGE